MSRNNRIWKRVLTKKVGHTHFTRKIVISQEGLSHYRVVQEYELSRLRRYDSVRSSPQTSVDCYEWTYSTREAAVDQAEKCVRDSERDAWELLPSSLMV